MTTIDVRQPPTPEQIEQWRRESVRRRRRKEAVARLGQAAAMVIGAALNVLVVFWLGQLAFPSLGLVPPTILGAIGITGLAWILRRPLPVARWMRG